MTMNAPLAFTHAKMTWMGVMLRWTAALTGALTGPFGYVLISLLEGRVCESSVCRSSLLDWKKDRNQTEPNCKKPDHRLWLHKF